MQWINQNYSNGISFDKQPQFSRQFNKIFAAGSWLSQRLGVYTWKRKFQLPRFCIISSFQQLVCQWVHSQWVALTVRKGLPENRRSLQITADHHRSPQISLILSLDDRRSL